MDTSNRLKVFVDDVRNAPSNDWIVIRTYKDAYHFIDSNYKKIITISLDHDLGDNSGTGYKLVCLLETLANHYKWAPKILVHSMNPVGRQKIISAVEKIERIVANNEDSMYIRHS